MIVHVPKQREHPNRDKKPFNDLVDYVTEDFDKGMAPPGFNDILSYTTNATDTLLGVDKCIAVETHGVTSPATAALEMNAVAAKNPRVQDPAYHVILSWPEHERPEPKDIFDAARHMLKTLGLEEHQYLLAIHDNTDNRHCHIAVNRVHPLTFKSQHLAWTHLQLHRAAREVEIEKGWTHDNGLYVVQLDQDGSKSIARNSSWREVKSDSAAQEEESNIAIWHDADSLLDWARQAVAPRLKKTLPDIASWQELHSVLATEGISLSDSGGGGMRLTVTQPDTGEILTIAASKALRQLKRADLEARFGPFEPKFAIPANLAAGKKGVNHDLTNPAGNRRVPPPFRRDRLHDLSSLDVVRDTEGGELLLPLHVSDLLEQQEADPNHPLRRPDTGGPKERLGDNADGRAVATDGRSAASSEISDPTPTSRERRRQERAKAREDLQKRYAEYRDAIKEQTVEYRRSKRDLSTARQGQLSALTQTLRQQRKDILTNVTFSDEDKALALAALAAKKLEASLIVQRDTRVKLDVLAATRTAPLSWREWLLEQANLGDQSALSALRGIVYQAKRDAKRLERKQSEALTAAPSPTVNDTSGNITAVAPAAGSASLDKLATDRPPDAYLKAVGELIEEEKAEVAIRPAVPYYMRPHQIDALIRKIQDCQFRVTGNGNIQYLDSKGTHLFTDRGNRLTFDRAHVSDDDIRLALLHARAKYGNALTLTGLDPIFTQRMALLADDLGLTILNPEVQTAILAHRSLRDGTPLPVFSSAVGISNESIPAGSLPDGLAKTDTPSKENAVPGLSSSAGHPDAPISVDHRSIEKSAADAHPAGNHLAEAIPEEHRSAEKLPAEAFMAALASARQHVLDRDPLATFITPSGTGKYRGVLMEAGEPDVLLQRITAHKYIIHALQPPSPLPDTPVTVNYVDGKPSIVTRERGR